MGFFGVYFLFSVFFFFFFSSRRRHTRSLCDWSSDVCSSDLVFAGTLSDLLFGVRAADPLTFGVVSLLLGAVALAASYLPARWAARIDPRSEERRVGKECRSRGWAYQ